MPADQKTEPLTEADISFLIVALTAYADRARFTKRRIEAENIFDRCREVKAKVSSQKPEAGSLPSAAALRPPTSDLRLDSANHFIVTQSGNRIVIQRRPGQMTRLEAINLAAWLYVLSAATELEFDRLTSEIEKS